ncbi:MAG: hypothetical protein GEU78_02795 [Actinobacteria bacterium]|nr:hypothetical protein [Actinomycetota bacterium]
MESDDRASEFDRILEDLSYELTSARAIALSDPDSLRVMLRRMRDLIADADSLASGLGAERRKAEGFSGRSYDER